MITLSNQQNALHEVLTRNDVNLGIMYFGTLYVLTQTENPDRLSLAAHGIRELMEKIPAYLDIQIKAQKENLKSKVIEVQNNWNNVIEQSSCHSKDKGWNGKIDARLGNFLSKLELFFDWFSKHHPRRKQEVARTLQKLDHSGRQLPTPLEDLAIRNWNKIRDFFLGIAHHNHECTQEEFSRWLDAFEVFLLDRLKPRTFDDFSMIDQIIQQGEQHGNE